MTDVTVLIIDADEANNQFMSQLLRKRGYRVFTSTSGKDGLMRVNDYLPGVIICDTELKDISPLELIQRLQQDRRFMATSLVAISNRYDAAEMERCLGAGYIEYYAKSGTAALALVDSIPRLITESARKNKKDERGVLCVFMSAKGGSGTSSLCANITQNLAINMQQSKTAVVDLVLPMGSIASIVGYDGDLHLGNIAQKVKEGVPANFYQESLPAPGGWGFHLLPGSPDPEVSAHLQADQIPAIIKGMRDAYHYVIVDMGRMLSRIVMPFILEAEAVVLVLGTDLSSVGLTKKLWNYLQAQGVQPDRVYPILNRAVGLQGLSKPEAEKILGINIRVTVPYMMENFALANNLHIPIATKYPTDTACMVLKQTAAEISQKAIKIRTGELKTPPGA